MHWWMAKYLIDWAPSSDTPNIDTPNLKRILVARCFI